MHACTRVRQFAPTIFTCSVGYGQARTVDKRWAASANAKETSNHGPITRKRISERSVTAVCPTHLHEFIHATRHARYRVVSGKKNRYRVVSAPKEYWSGTPNRPAQFWQATPAAAFSCLPAVRGQEAHTGMPISAVSSAPSIQTPTRPPPLGSTLFHRSKRL